MISNPSMSSLLVVAGVYAEKTAYMLYYGGRTSICLFFSLKPTRRLRNLHLSRCYIGISMFWRVCMLPRLLLERVQYSWREVAIYKCEMPSQTRIGWKSDFHGFDSSLLLGLWAFRRVVCNYPISCQVVLLLFSFFWFCCLFVIHY